MNPMPFFFKLANSRDSASAKAFLAAALHFLKAIFHSSISKLKFSISKILSSLILCCLGVLLKTNYAFFFFCEFLA